MLWRDLPRRNAGESEEEEGDMTMTHDQQQGQVSRLFSAGWGLAGNEQGPRPAGAYLAGRARRPPAPQRPRWRTPRWGASCCSASSGSLICCRSNGSGRSGRAVGQGGQVRKGGPQQRPSSTEEERAQRPPRIHCHSSPIGVCQRPRKPEVSRPVPLGCALGKM